MGGAALKFYPFDQNIKQIDGGAASSHRDSTRASTLYLFFSSFEHVKSLLIMGPNNTKNSPLKCDFLIFNYE
jgi:hypothetical protein